MKQQQMNFQEELHRKDKDINILNNKIEDLYKVIQKTEGEVEKLRMQVKGINTAPDFQNKDLYSIKCINSTNVSQRRSKTNPTDVVFSFHLINDGKNPLPANLYAKFENF